MQGILGNTVALCGRCHFLPALRPSGGQIFKADSHFMGIFIKSSCPAGFLWQYFVAWILRLYSFDCHYFSSPSISKVCLCWSRCPARTCPGLQQKSQEPCVGPLLHVDPIRCMFWPQEHCGSTAPTCAESQILTAGVNTVIKEP